MVALDVRGARSPAGFDDVGVEGALDEEGDLFAFTFLSLEHEVGGSGLEGADELAADDLALLLRVGDSGELGQELFARIDGDEADADRVDVVLFDLDAFVLTQQTVIDEDAGELVADGLVDERCGHGGVDSAGEAADDPTGADLLADEFDLFVDDGFVRPVGGEAGDVEQEVLEDLLPVLRVEDFGVPLHAGELLRRAFEGCDGGVRGGGEDVEAGGRLGDGVPVGHPDLVVARGLGQECSGLRHGDRGGSVFALIGLGYAAAEGGRHELEAVADAHRGHSEVEHRGVEVRGGGVVDARGATGEHDGHGVLRRELGRGRVVGDDLRVQAGFADAARDELGVLGAEIDDEDGGHLRALGLRHDPILSVGDRTPEFGSDGHLSAGAHASTSHLGEGGRRGHGRLGGGELGRPHHRGCARIGGPPRGGWVLS